MRWLALLVAVGLVVSAAPGEAALRLSADAPERGWIDVRMAGGDPGATVALRERGSPVRRVRLDRRGRALAGHVAAWRCDRRRRRFTAAGAKVAQVTTPSCAGRLSLAVAPSRPRAGRSFEVRVTDRWRLGRLAVVLCVLVPSGTGPCAPTRLRPTGARVGVRPLRAGRWRVVVQGRGVRATEGLTVRPRHRRLTVLATGDSLMEAVRYGLGRVLPAGIVLHPDANNGAGISNSFRFSWRPHAVATVRRWRPDVVVVFIGGNEGFPIDGVECCGGHAWIDAYAARVRADMALYAQDGTAQVYWLTLAAPGLATHWPMWITENLGLEQAAQGLAPGVRLTDLRPIFTPGFVFRTTMPVRGRPTVVRTPDRVHLSYAGGIVAGRVVLAAMRADGIVPGRGG